MGAVKSQTFQKRPTVKFDPRNAEHVRAFRMQCIGEVDQDGTVRRRSHPTLRFQLEQPYTSVITMMLAKVAQAYVENMETQCAG